MTPIRVLNIFGTRPEAIKMAPLLLALAQDPMFTPITCLTAQHREMLDSVMDLFGLTADYDLNIMTPGQTLAEITTRALGGLERMIAEAEPDVVLVHGDTTTTFSGALAAFYAKVPVGHVEAGLRSFDLLSPFPEEANRKLVGQIAAMHFAPTLQNAKNLAAEGITTNVFVTGNTVIDAMRYSLAKFPGQFYNTLDTLDFAANRVITLTCHRRENYGKPMEQIFTAVRNIVDTHPDVLVVYPVHPAPTVMEAAFRILGNTERICLIEPLDTVQMHALLSKSHLVLTDSGGLQEEAPALGKPVFVLRRETERPEGITAGTVRLVGVETDDIVRETNRVLTDASAYAAMANAKNPYGDGQAATRITQALAYYFGRTDAPPAPFSPLGGE